MKTLNKKLKTGYNHESNYYKQTHVYQSAWSGPNSLLGWALFSEDWSLLHRSTSSPRLICHSTTGWSRDSFSFPQWYNFILKLWLSGRFLTPKDYTQNSFTVCHKKWAFSKSADAYRFFSIFSFVSANRTKHLFPSLWMTVLPCGFSQSELWTQTS